MVVPLIGAGLSHRQLSEKWGPPQTSVFGNERLTGALLDRLTHHVHILEMNGDSYRLKHSKARRRSRTPDQTEQAAAQAVNPETGEVITD